MLDVGIEAPQFQVQLHTGVLFHLQDVLGKKHLVLYFYPKDFTLGCTKESCAFRDHSLELEELGAAVIGVSPDSVESHRDFARTHRLPFPLASDIDFGVARKYDLVRRRGLPIKRVTYVIDKSGIIRAALHHEAFIGKHIEEAIKILKTLNRTSG